MFTELYIPVIRTVCPETKDEQSCPVRQYLKNNQNLFHMSFYGTNLVPNSYDALKISHELIKIREICSTCNKNNIK